MIMSKKHYEVDPVRELQKKDIQNACANCEDWEKQKKRDGKWCASCEIYELLKAIKQEEEE